MDLAVYLDLVATIPPALGILILLRAKVSVREVKGGRLLRLNAGLMSTIFFDILRLLGYGLAVYGILVSLWLILALIGNLAATFYYGPDTRSFKEDFSRLIKHPSFHIYHVILLVWLTFNIAIPSLYFPTTLLLLTAIIVYPTRLFLLARQRAGITRIKDMLTILTISWASFSVTGLLFFALGAQPPVLGLSLSYGWEVGFLGGSVFFFLMSKAVIDPSGLTKSWAGLLVPETIVRLGKRYLIVHDSGAKAQGFLASSFKNLIGAGARIVVRASTQSPLLQQMLQSDKNFVDWMKNGKILAFQADNGKSIGVREGFSGRLGLGQASTVYVTELCEESLFEKDSQPSERESPNLSELFLLERSKAPRSQIAEFMRRNSDVQLLDLSERASPFSSLVNLDHMKLQGSTILLVYESASNYENAVDKFLSEGIANAEVSVLFTSKSSKLYRAIKGKKMVKIVAASSLVSAPDELPDGEVQIPDRELGLVTSIASDLLENSKNMNVSFVFDSLTDLIRDDRWEQVYSGVKQIVELLSVPNASALFLANRDSCEPRFLGALRSLFSVQMKLDAGGLQVTKLGTT